MLKHMHKQFTFSLVDWSANENTRVDHVTVDGIDT